MELITPSSSDNYLSIILNKIILQDSLNNIIITESISNLVNQIIICVNNILESTKIIEDIFKELVSISVLPIINDIPILLNVILNCEKLINHLKKLNIDKKEFKYYIFAILYHIIEKYNINVPDNELIDMYNLIWNFVLFDINKNINCFQFIKKFFKS